jgi:hypothetical protein
MGTPFSRGGAIHEFCWTQAPGDVALSSRDDGSASRPCLRKIFDTGPLPSNCEMISPGIRAEGVRLIEAALESASPGTSSLTRASPAGLRKPPGSLKFRSLDDLFAALFEIDNGQMALCPVCAGKNPPVGCHPHRRAASSRSNKALDAEHACQHGLSCGDESGRPEQHCEALPELFVAHAEPISLRRLVDIDAQVGAE